MKKKNPDPSKWYHLAFQESLKGHPVNSSYAQGWQSHTHSVYAEIILGQWYETLSKREILLTFWKQLCHLGSHQVFQSIKTSELEPDIEYNLFCTRFIFMWFLTLNPHITLKHSSLTKHSFKVAQQMKNLLALQEMQVWSLGREDSLE